MRTCARCASPAFLLSDLCSSCHRAELFGWRAFRAHTQSDRTPRALWGGALQGGFVTVYAIMILRSVPSRLLVDGATSAVLLAAFAWSRLPPVEGRPGMQWLPRVRTVPLALLAANVVFPRTTVAQAVTVGLRVGATRSSVVSGWDGSRRNGITAGLSARLQVTPVVGLQLEALYSQKGRRAGDQHLFLDYVEVPVLVRLSLPHRLLGLTVSGLGGVTAATELSCRWRTASGVDSEPGAPISYVVDADCIGLRNQLNDFGLVAGAQLERRLAVGHLTIEGRYVHGTKNLSYGGDVLRNRSVALIFGFGLDVFPRRGSGCPTSACS